MKNNPIEKLVQSNKFNEAIKTFNSLNKDQKNNNFYRYSYCEALFFNQNYLQAYEIAKLILKEADSFKNVSFLSGLIAMQLDKIDDAIYLFDRASVINPKNIDAYIHLSQLLVKKKLFKKSISILNSGLKNNPGNLNLYFELGRKLLDINNYEIALKIFLEIKKQDPEFKLINMNIGVVHNYLGNFEKSLEFTLIDYEKDPNDSEINFNLGNLYLEEGNFKQAKIHYAIAKLNPNLKSETLRQLCFLSDETNREELIKECEIEYANMKKNNCKNDVMLLGYGLAALYEKKKQFKNSYNCFSLSNKLRKEKLNFDINIFQSQIESLIEIFSKDFIHQFKQFDHLKPIFICGLPRSGTTLTEQIISSHSQVVKGGELDIIQKVFKKHFPQTDNFELKNKINEILLKDYKKISEEILTNYTNLPLLSDVTKKQKNFFTDKLPFNYLFIGFIKVCLPNAKIIHCQRNPRENCFSILKNYFPGEQITFSYSENDLFHYYNGYKKLMSHWNKIFKNDIYNLSYENLINHFESEVKCLIEYCGLKWEEACLEYYKSENKIKTISAVQARQPIYKTSQNLSENYKGFFTQDFLNIPTKI